LRSPLNGAARAVPLYTIRHGRARRDKPATRLVVRIIGRRNGGSRTRPTEHGLPLIGAPARWKLGAGIPSCAHLAVVTSLSPSGEFEGVIDLDAQVPRRRLQFRVSEEQLHGTQVLGAPIDQRRLGPAHRVSAVVCTV
jgi:hypothetical protein